MSIDEHKFRDMGIAGDVEPEDMSYGGDLTHPFIVPEGDAIREASLSQFVGRRFITPRRLVVECLAEKNGELQFRYVTLNPDGQSVDFTIEAARKLLIAI